MSRNRLLIFHPTIELGWNRTWVSLLQIKHIGALIDMGRFVPSVGSMIVTTHNKCVAEAMESKWLPWSSIDYVGFFEYDHEFPADIIERAFQYKEPVVSALYHYRERPFFPLVYFWDENGGGVRTASPQEYAKFRDQPGLYEVGGVPMGAIFIRRDVFEKFIETYPDDPLFAAPVNRMTDLRTGKQTYHAMTDDLWFSRHIIDMGFKIYVDTAVEVKHLIVTAVDGRFYVAELQRQMAEAEARKKAAEAQADGEGPQLKVVRNKIVTPAEAVKEQSHV